MMRTAPAASPDTPRAGAGGAERAVVAALAIAIIAFPLLPRAGLLACAGVCSLATVVAIARRWAFATPIGVVFSAYTLASGAGLVLSQVDFALGIAAYLVVARLAPWLPPVPPWLRRGEIDRVVVLVAAGFTVAAGVALVTWHQVFRPDLSDILETFIPDVSLWLLLLGAVAFSMVNAAVEEIAYRGVLMHGVSGALASPAVALIAQAVAFGALHINGFPRGPVGVGLATIYGLMMGIVRMRSKGMLAPWVAHIATDMTIVVILLSLAR